MRGQCSIAAVVVLAALTAGCGRSDVVPFPLAVETAWLAGVTAPPSWQPYVRTIGEGQVLRSISGVTVVLAGEERAGSLQATSAGTAWESPDLRLDDPNTACDAAATYLRSAGATTTFSAATCAAAIVDPGLQTDFVLSFWSEVNPTATGSRSFGAGALLHPGGSTTLVVSLSATLGE